MVTPWHCVELTATPGMMAVTKGPLRISSRWGTASRIYTTLSGMCHRWSMWVRSPLERRRSPKAWTTYAP